MVKNTLESDVTAEQRQEIRRICQEARVTDKSGEMFTREITDAFILDMRRKVEQGILSRRGRLEATG